MYEEDQQHPMRATTLPMPYTTSFESHTRREGYTHYVLKPKPFNLHPGIPQAQTIQLKIP